MQGKSVGKAVRSGLVATLVMTLIMYVAPLMGMPKMDVAAMLGSTMSRTTPEPMSGLWFVGMVLHFVNGSVIFPLIFASALYARLPGRPWLRGTIWGLVLWVLSQAMVMPMMGAGFFSGHAPQPMLTVIGSLMGHIIYGAILGGLYGEGPAAELHAS
jgi:uncharacterized membrane protein YagU involved in acid resistance